MNKKIKRYVDNLFKEAPKTRRIYELKEEILANTNDNYNDLIQMGLDEESSYNKAISNIGNIEELIQDNYDFIQEEKEYQKKSGLITAIAVMMYIICPIPLIVLACTNNDNLVIIGVAILLTIVALATGMLIYNDSIKPKYINTNDELYEEFKEWKYEKEEGRNGEKSIISIIGSLTVLVYFIVSFYYGNWGVSWIIFLIGGSIKQIIRAYFDLKGEKAYEKK